MDSITIENFRCFRERQTARLAPLTLLVGNNSTGKTSFLALIRALWEIAFLDEAPDFQKDPYDLGTFRDIAHNRGRGGGQASSFKAGFEYTNPSDRLVSAGRASLSVIFEERGAVPFPAVRRFAKEQTRIDVCAQLGGKYVLKINTPQIDDEYKSQYSTYAQDDVRLLPKSFLFQDILGQYQNALINSTEDSATNRVGLQNKGIDSVVDELAGNIRDLIDTFIPSLEGSPFVGPPLAAAPIRSRPRRTYDPVRPSQDPEGEYIPTYLASISHRSQSQWRCLKAALEDFGTASGLFDEITIKSLGKTEGSPFQVQIRKFGESRRRKGPFKNLIDVGYGVSQALPVITELLREGRGSPEMFLLQQPEVHLHPSAQAALGSLFCSIVADRRRQIIVETHSDYLIDRVRMDVRDKKTSLRPKDVSILFFERDELDVKIHSIGIDEHGNILNAPPSYGKFFMEETRRSIGL